MLNYSGDFVTTYEPKYVEHHDDSSEFDEFIPITDPKQGNHNLVSSKPSRKHKKTIKRKRSNKYINYDEYPVKLKQENVQELPSIHQHKQHSQIHVSNDKNIHSTDDKTTKKIQPAPSKISVLFKHKLIPCFSNMFKRTNHSSKQMSTIQENRVENNTASDNCYNRCSDCQQRRIRKLYHSRNYAVQPVYVLEGNAHKTPASFVPAKITEAPVKNHNHKIYKDQYCDPRTASSSESDLESAMERRKHKITNFRKMLKAEIMKEHRTYHLYQKRKHQHLQYPSEDHPKFPYQVYNTPYQSRTLFESKRDTQHLGELPSSTSHFWEYLFDKFSRKYQTHRVGVTNPCYCGHKTPPATKTCCTNTNKFPETDKAGGSNCNYCNQNPVNGNSFSFKSKQGQTNNRSNRSNSNRPSPVAGSINGPFPSIPMKFKLPDQPKKIICKCKEAMDTQDQNSVPIETNACQEGHDKITNSLADRYNGEILCIHNPPCILINGCLNLPSQEEQQQMSFWPVLDLKKSLFDTKMNLASRERSCQYHVPSIEVQQCEVKPEKMVQSLCNHDPPCEVVRGCCKTMYDPKLQSFCVHVPMCEKVPECSVGKSSVEPCSHRPKCQDIPLCTRKYVMSPKESVATQVVPLSPGCHHDPPCAMIPKCLANNVPECSHQPCCDPVPACLMKTARDMVSVSSQYPNACRIV